MEEIWKDIEGYEGLYMVSNLGRVKSLNYHLTGKERILSPGKNSWGYLYVVLCKNGKMKSMRVHRLVAQAFINNPNNLPQVNHKDEDKSNNTVDNLEFCTNEYNTNYGTHNERSAEARSKKVYQYSLDGVLIKEWQSTRECDKNGFDSGHVSSCCNCKRKTHKGFKWSYFKI